MSVRLIGRPPAVLALLITLTLVAGELANAGQRRVLAGLVSGVWLRGATERPGRGQPVAAADRREQLPHGSV